MVRLDLSFFTNCLFRFKINKVLYNNYYPKCGATPSPPPSLFSLARLAGLAAGSEARVPGGGAVAAMAA